MSETGSTAELRREWFAARVIFVAGFVVAIAFAVIWSVTHRPEVSGIGDETAVADAGAAAPTQEGLMACRGAFLIAQNFGVVPNALKFAGGPNKTDTVGRYSCFADDGGTRYTVTFDLVCRQLNDARCISLYTAAKPNAPLLYQRQGDAVAPAPEAPAPDASATDGSTEAAPADGSSPDATDGAGAGAPKDDGSAPPQQQP